MANTITKTTLIDGPRNLVVLVNIVGDASGNESGTVLLNRSDYAPTDGTEFSVKKIEGHLSGFSAQLLFEATADLEFAQLPASDYFCYDWRCEGGISSNKAGAGANGDILITTSDLGAERGTFTIHCTKQ
jgi:hypothetical protein